MRLVVYKYGCPKCGDQYVGSTVRSLATRTAEHAGISVRTGLPLSQPPQSQIREHLLEQDPVGVSLAGMHTNCLTYFSIPRYLSTGSGLLARRWWWVGSEAPPKWGPIKGLAHAKSIPLEITLDFMMTVQKCIIRTWQTFWLVGVVRQTR